MVTGASPVWRVISLAAGGGLVGILLAVFLLWFEHLQAEAEKRDEDGRHPKG